MVAITFLTDQRKEGNVWLATDSQILALIFKRLAARSPILCHSVSFGEPARYYLCSNLIFYFCFLCEHRKCRSHSAAKLSTISNDLK